MSYLRRLRRYVALPTYEPRQAWRQFKKEATELWQDWGFRLKYRTDKCKGVQRRAIARRTVADAFLRDAQRVENSMRTRADWAFEACYLYAIAALGAAADGYEHPRREALVAGGEALGLLRHDISPALAYFGKRYGGTADAAEDMLSFKTLRSLAMKMQALRGEERDA